MFTGLHFLTAIGAFLKKWLAETLLIILLIVFASVVLSLLGKKCLFVDDGIHIPSGYSYLRTRDFRLNQEHPPLVKLLSAIGLTRVKPDLPLDSEGWQKAEEPGDPDDGTMDFCREFFDRNAVKFEQIAFWGRAPVVIIPILIALAIWFFGKALFGKFTALFAVFLFLIEPNIIGNSTLVQDDLASALAILVFIICLRAYLKAPTLLRASILGVVIGFALLTKHSLVVLLPIGFLVLCFHFVWQVYKKKPSPCRYVAFGVVVMLCAYLVLIAGYAFHVDWIDEDEAEFIAGWWPISGRFSASFQALLMHLPVMLPQYFLYGLDSVVTDLRTGRPAFLFGKVSNQGWWYYFPAAFALKASIPLFSATLAGLAWTIREIVKRKWTDGIYLLAPPLLYLGMSMRSHLNIGIRHLLPVFPFFAVMGAAVITSSGRQLSGTSRKLRDAVVLVFVAWSLILAVVTYPNYLTYFSPLAGGVSNGWRLLSDSNVETGQEVKTLADYLKKRGTTEVAGLFMGSGFIKYYGITLCEFPCEEDEDLPTPPKYAAIGAWYLQEVDVTPEQKEIVDSFRNRQPEAMIGNSIFVYRIQNTSY